MIFIFYVKSHANSGTISFSTITVTLKSPLNPYFWFVSNIIILSFWHWHTVKTSIAAIVGIVV